MTIKTNFTLQCPDCEKEFLFEYKYEPTTGHRDKIIKEIYLDCPNSDCGETNKYTIELES